MAVPPPPRPRGRIPIFDQFRRILLRLHLLRRLSHLLNTALHCTKIYIWPALQWHSNVDAVLHSILSCAFLRVRSGGVETTYNTPRNPLYTTKEFFFKSRFITEYYAIARWRYFTTTTRILFVFSFHVSFFKFGNPSEMKSPNLNKKAKSWGFWSQQ